MFTRYLTYLIQHCNEPVRVSYRSLDRTAELEFGSDTPSLSSARPSISNFTFHILTPVFYSRFVSYNTLESALAAEVLSTTIEENRTSEVSSPAEFRALLLRAALAAKFPKLMPRSQSLFSLLVWKLIYILRCPPPQGYYPNPGNPSLREQVVLGASITGGMSLPPEAAATPQKSERDRVIYNFLDEFRRYGGAGEISACFDTNLPRKADCFRRGAPVERI